MNKLILNELQKASNIGLYIEYIYKNLQSYENTKWAV